MSASKQTRAYRIWDGEAEEALRAGVRKHGLGAWELIRKDPEFETLGDRTGVQLKDKWRNLVKFRHIGPDEQKTYKVKSSGPWSKKYSSSQFTRDSSAAAGVASEDVQPSDDEPDAAAADTLAVKLEDGEAQHATEENAAKCTAARKRKLFQAGSDAADAGSDDEEPDTVSDPGHADAVGPDANGTDTGPGCVDEMEDGGDGSEGDEGRRGLRRSSRRKSPRGARKASEDRRFGIYDRRRYGPGGRPGCPGGPVTGSGKLRRRKARSRGHAGDDDDDDDLTEDDEYSGMGEDEDDEEGAAAAAAGANDGGMEEEDSYIIACPCGITYDDGEMMIECERCRVWAHLECLKQQMAQPGISYDFDTYQCNACQMGMDTPAAQEARRQLALQEERKLQRHMALKQQHLAALGGRGRGQAYGNGAGAASRKGRKARASSETESDESEQKASELSNILLGMANGNLAAVENGRAAGYSGLGAPRGNGPSKLRAQSTGSAGDAALLLHTDNNGPLPLFQTGRSGSIGSREPSSLPGLPGLGKPPTGHTSSHLRVSSSLEGAGAGVALAGPSGNGSKLSAPKAMQHPAIARTASAQNLQLMDIAAGGPLGPHLLPPPQGSGLGHHPLHLHHLNGATAMQMAAVSNLLGLPMRRPLDGSGSGASDGPGGAAPNSGVQRPTSAMAREAASTIFGDSDEEDHSGRPVSALRDPLFLLGAGGSRAGTPSAALVETFMRSTPDIAPLAALLSAASPPPNGALCQSLGQGQPPGSLSHHHLAALIRAASPALLGSLQLPGSGTTPGPGLSALVGLPMFTMLNGTPGINLPVLASSMPGVPGVAGAAAAAAGGPGVLWPLQQPATTLPAPAPLQASAGVSAEQHSNLHPVLRQLLLQQQTAAGGPGGAAAAPGHGGEGALSRGSSSRLAEAGGSSRLQGVRSSSHDGTSAARTSDSGVAPIAAGAVQAGKAFDGRQATAGAAGPAALSPAASMAGLLHPLLASAAMLQQDLRLSAAGPAAGGGSLQPAGGSLGGAHSTSSFSNNAHAQAVKAELASALAGTGLLDGFRTSTPDPWGMFRTSTPNAETLLLQTLVPAAQDALSWLKSSTPPPLDGIAGLSGISAAISGLQNASSGALPPLSAAQAMAAAAAAARPPSGLSSAHTHNAPAGGAAHMLVSAKSLPEGEGSGGGGGPPALFSVEQLMSGPLVLEPAKAPAVEPKSAAA